MPTRGHKSRLIPRYPASPHPPHPVPWPTHTGLLYWLTIQQGQMNPSCRESEAGHRTITRNPYCPVQDCGRTTYGRCPPEGTNLTGYPASPYHLQLRTQASMHRTTLARLDSRQTMDRHGHEWHHQDKGQVRTYSVYGIVTTDYWTISSSWTNFGLHQFRNQQAGLGTGPGPAGIKNCTSALRLPLLW